MSSIIIYFFYCIFYLLNHAVLNCEGIINGQEAIPGEFPFMVSLRNETGRHYCGGSLITRKHVVTAAHCLFTDESVFSGGVEERYPPENITVIVDTISTQWYPGESCAVEKITPHPNYNITNFMTILYDIGIITLKSEVESQRVIPIALPLSRPAVGQKATIVGWGVSNRQHINTRQTALILQKLDMTIQSVEDCRSKYDTEPSLYFVGHGLQTLATFCAFQKEAGPCIRDSGSPIIQDNTLTGIVIYGVPCANGYPDVFTTIHGYLSFIQENTSTN